MKSYNIILASASPRRRELIKQIKNINVEIFPADIDEIIDGGLSIYEAVMSLAEQKAEFAFKARGGITLGADTVVVINGEILGKPKDFNEAESMFYKLCGNTHEVITGIALISDGIKVKNYEKTYVTFGAFNDKIVYNYIKSGQSYDKAGGYGIQDEELKSLIKEVRGDLNNVIGLPVALTEKLLKENIFNDY